MLQWDSNTQWKIINLKCVHCYNTIILYKKTAVLTFGDSFLGVAGWAVSLLVRTAIWDFSEGGNEIHIEQISLLPRICLEFVSSTIIGLHNLRLKQINKHKIESIGRYVLKRVPDSSEGLIDKLLTQWAYFDISKLDF